jgi:hypothetical protein
VGTRHPLERMGPQTSASPVAAELVDFLPARSEGPRTSIPVLERLPVISPSRQPLPWCRQVIEDARIHLRTGGTVAPAGDAVARDINTAPQCL